MCQSCCLVADIDECSNRTLSRCAQGCENSAGSYRCVCERGYFLEEDGRSCTKGDRGESTSCTPSLDVSTGHI